MAAKPGTVHDPGKMELKRIKRHVVHKYPKAIRLSHASLLERDATAQSGFESKRTIGLDVFVDEKFELPVDLLADNRRDRPVRSAVQLSGSVVRVKGARADKLKG